MDRLSSLPEPIVHDILSRLPGEDAARTSVLSKAWRDTWSTFPTLVFDESKYRNWKKSMTPPSNLLRTRNDFLNFVESRVEKFHNQGLAIEQFELWMIFNDVQSIFARIDHWMERAVNCGVQVLDLTLQADIIRDKYKYYYLPPSLLEAKSLLKLRLSGRFRIDQTILNHPIEFSSLQELCLNGVYLGGEQVIHNLVSSCPLIEYITLEHCSWMRSVRIHGLPKLKGVKLLGEVMEVDVDAPSLEILRYHTCDYSANLYKMNVDKCRNLVELYIAGLGISEQWFLELSHKFPLLKILELGRCRMPRRMSISGLQLKVLNLRACSNLEKAYIDTPNLHSFTYHIRNHPSETPDLCILNSSNQLEINVEFAIISVQWDFPKFREFLQKLQRRKNVQASLSLSLFIQEANVEVAIDELPDLSVIPPSIKHLHIFALRKRETVCLTLVTGLLWSCRPTTISFALCNRTFIMVFCEKLMSMKEKDCCCNSSHINCWWHGLKDVKVSSSSWNDGNVVDCQSFLNLLPALPLEGVISISLEW